MNEKRDNIYIYLWEELNTIYIGRTVNPKSRHYQHRHIPTEKTYQFSSEHGAEHPKMIIIENNLSIEEGVEREKYWIGHYRNKTDYDVLNKTRGGEVGQLPKLTEEERINHKKESNKEYRESHKEEMIIYKKIYNEKNKEKIKLKKRIWYESHKEEIKKKNKEYRESHKEEARIFQKAYRENNKEKIREYKKEYSKEHKEKIKKYMRNWYINNKENQNIKTKKYYETHKEEILNKEKEKRERKREAKK